MVRSLYKGSARGSRNRTVGVCAKTGRSPLTARRRPLYDVRVQGVLFVTEPIPGRQGKYARRRKRGAAADAADVMRVWGEWVRVHRPGQESRVKLTEEREERISWAVATYGADACVEAIEGCKLSPFHQGDNDRRRKYDDVELILRDAAKIERFRDIAREHRSRPKGADF